MALLSTLVEDSAVKARRTARAMMPALAESVSREPSSFLAPSIVNVLPVPVWPYANTVQLYPASTSSTTGATDCSNSCSCVALASYTRSNVNRRVAAAAGMAVLLGGVAVTSLRSVEHSAKCVGGGRGRQFLHGRDFQQR